MKSIRIDFIEQADHRYPTLGDYFETEEEVVFKITRFDNPLYSIGILIHELAEKYIKDKEGVSDGAVDAFDLAHPELNDPGMSPEAPYHSQHLKAYALEHAFMGFAGEHWGDYEKTIFSVFDEEAG